MNVKRPPKIAIVSGQWGQNIGNAFFNLGGFYLMEQVFGSESVGFFQDQPNYRTLHNKFKGNPENYIDFIRHLDIEYLVLQGPVLNSWMRISWEKTFKELRASGVKVILNSCAFFKFTSSEMSAVKDFLEEYPPHLILTRDSRSYEVLKGWIPDVPKYDGIDAGFFLNKAVKPFSKKSDYQYMVSNFDRYPEPNISLRSVQKAGVHLSEVIFKEQKICLETPKFQNFTAHKSKIWSYFGDLFDRRKLPEEFLDLKIIRPEPRYFPHMTHKIYRQPNSLSSDEPWTYISLYSNSNLTLSDRVHACVATLVFGNPAMLFTPSPRSALFGRVGLEDISKKIVELDMEFLADEQERQIAWLKENV